MATLNTVTSSTRPASPAAGEAGRVDDVIKSNLAMSYSSSIGAVQASVASTVSIAE